MHDAIVKCPKCGAEVPLTESLAAPMVAAVRQEMQAQVDAARKAADDAVYTANVIKNDATRKIASFEQEVADRVSQDAKAIRIEAQREAAESVRAVHAEVEALRTKLTDAQKAQAAALKRERELVDKERELDLTVEMRVTDGVDAARSAARRESDEANKLKLLEKDMLLDSLQGKIVDLQQKIEQGSQQLQGEVQELDLEAQLRSRFPHDEVAEVAKGVNGADVQHSVISPSGAQCGLILWESKRTKRWSDGWLSKLREDGRRAGADLLVIVSVALPDVVETFDQIDGVWICAPKAAVPLAAALRAALLGAHNVRQVQAGMKSKSEEVYAYVTGPQFKRRVEALVEAFTTMQEDLTAEQKAVQRMWAKRAAQIERVLTSTSGLFGDMQGIAGKALPEPAGLALMGGGE